jgi:thiamine-phosphate pyrophosphorylase
LFGDVRLSGTRRVGFRLYLITDRRAVRSASLLDACQAALQIAADLAPPGSVALQLREKELDAGEVYGLACRLREMTTRVGAPLFINERVDIAVACDADGVHLPVASIGAGAARRLLGTDRLVGVSTHSVADVVAASREGQADFAVFGPVYAPLSKGSYGAVRGPAPLFQACKAGSLPVFALGGITPARVAELYSNAQSVNLAGVAAIGSIIGAESPRHAMRAMLEALKVAPSS